MKAVVGPEGLGRRITAAGKAACAASPAANCARKRVGGGVGANRGCARPATPASRAAAAMVPGAVA